MFVIYGTHCFAPKRVGFRTDVCLSCGREAISVEFRSFDVGHVYWLPLLPLGFRRHWQCSECGEDPRGERTRQGMKVLGVIAFLLAGVAMWLGPTDEGDAGLIWAMRFGFPALAIALVFSMRERQKQDLGLVARLRRLPPIGDACPVCAGRITGRPRRCTRCGAFERRAPELAA